MTEDVIDVGGLYERAKEAARVAVAGSPGADYGLEDVLSVEQWHSVGSSDLISLIPVSATLNGCLEVLLERKVTAPDVERLDPLPPARTAITKEDIQAARSWLSDAIAADVDEEGRQAFIDREAGDRGWHGDPVRVTSLVLALVLIAGAAAAPDH